MILPKKRVVPVTMYKVLRQVEDRLIQMESCETLQQAVQLMEKLNGMWPGKYVIRDSEGNDVDLME
jgi:hypothetical protein